MGSNDQMANWMANLPTAQEWAKTIDTTSKEQVLVDKEALEILLDAFEAGFSKEEHTISAWMGRKFEESNTVAYLRCIEMRFGK